MLHIGTRCSLAHAQSDDHTAASGAFHRRPNPAGLPRVAIPAATFILNLHSSACRTAAVVQSAVSSLAGFRTPAPCLCLDLYGPASENLHKTGIRPVRAYVSFRRLRTLPVPRCYDQQKPPPRREPSGCKAARLHPFVRSLLPRAGSYQWRNVHTLTAFTADYARQHAPHCAPCCRAT